MTESASMVPAASGWHVTGQAEETRVNPGGDLERGMVVRFTTGQGVAGSVFVPDYAYPDKVAEMVAKRVAALDSVSNLSG
jgi:hypothetical protein